MMHPSLDPGHLIGIPAWNHSSFDPEKYRIHSSLNRGTYGQVFSLIHKETKDASKYIRKFVRVSVDCENHIESIKKEIHLGRHFTQFIGQPNTHKIAPAIVSYGVENVERKKKRIVSVEVFITYENVHTFVQKDETIDHAYKQKQKLKTHRYMLVSLFVALRKFTIYTGYLHGDLHLKNCYVVLKNGMVQRCVLIDFGLSQSLSTLMKQCTTAKSYISLSSASPTSPTSPSSPTSPYEDEVPFGKKISARKRQYSLLHNYNNPSFHASLDTFGRRVEYKTIDIDEMNTPFAFNSNMMHHRYGLKRREIEDSLHWADVEVNNWLEYQPFKKYIQYEPELRIWTRVRFHKNASPVTKPRTKRRSFMTPSISKVRSIFSRSKRVR